MGIKGVLKSRVTTYGFYLSSYVNSGVPFTKWEEQDLGDKSDEIKIQFGYVKGVFRCLSSNIK